MNIETIGITIGAIGAIASIVSIVYAIKAKNDLKKQKNHQIMNLRQTLRDAIVAMSNSYLLLKNVENYQISNPEAIARITSAHISSTDIIRAIYKELSTLDLPYDNAKLNGYVKSGLITSRWAWKEALAYADGQDSFIEPQDLPEDTPTNLFETN